MTDDGLSRLRRELEELEKRIVESERQLTELKVALHKLDDILVEIEALMRIQGRGEKAEAG